MDKNLELKTVVREKYGEIAKTGGNCCCGPNADFTIMADEYKGIDGYVPEADMSLGCGIPTEFARIEKGMRVLDLGSGAGNDVFVARTLVGEEGHVTGLDFTGEMLEKAESNRKKLGFENVDFVKGEIEEMPLHDNQYDVVISNCVLNLVPDKKKAFSEIYRVLKPGGRFCISDIVTTGHLPEDIRNAASLYAGCISGALRNEDYIANISGSGFENIKVEKEKPIVVPVDILKKHVSAESAIEFSGKNNLILSITVTGAKPNA